MYFSFLHPQSIRSFDWSKLWVFLIICGAEQNSHPYSIYFEEALSSLIWTCLSIFQATLVLTSALWFTITSWLLCLSQLSVRPLTSLFQASWIRANFLSISVRYLTLYSLRFPLLSCVPVSFEGFSVNWSHPYYHHHGQSSWASLNFESCFGSCTQSDRGSVEIEDCRYVRYYHDLKNWPSTSQYLRSYHYLDISFYPSLCCYIPMRKKGICWVRCFLALRLLIIINEEFKLKFSHITTNLFNKFTNPFFVSHFVELYIFINRFDGVIKKYRISQLI